MRSQRYFDFNYYGVDTVFIALMEVKKFYLIPETSIPKTPIRQIHNTANFAPVLKLHPEATGKHPLLQARPFLLPGRFLDNALSCLCQNC